MAATHAVLGTAAAAAVDGTATIAELPRTAIARVARRCRVPVPIVQPPRGRTNAIDRQHAGMRTGYGECGSRSRFDPILARTRPALRPLWPGVYHPQPPYPTLPP